MQSKKPKLINTIGEIHIKGSVVITDPCYLDHGIESDRNWMSVVSGFGLNPYIESNTLYGDWGCSVYNCTGIPEDSEKIGIKIGDFCADAGMVCVCELSNILEKNPKFQEFIDKHEWCVCVIPNFEGTVKINKRQCEYIDDNNQKQYDDIIMVEGEGMKDDKPFSFVSVQTSL